MVRLKPDATAEIMVRLKPDATGYESGPAKAGRHRRDHVESRTPPQRWGRMRAG